MLDRYLTDMTVHAYTEDQFAGQSAIGPFAELDWQTASAMQEVFGLTEFLRFGLNSNI